MPSDPQPDTAAAAAAQPKPDGATAPAATPPPEPKKPGSKRWLIVAIPLALILIAGALFYYVTEVAPFETTDDAFIDGQVISIRAQVSAIAAAVHVDDNQMVHKGDLLVELDPTDYQVVLNQMRGAESAARGRLEQARAGISSAQSAVAQQRANLDAARATLQNAEHSLARYEGLDPQARSQSDVDSAIANRATAAAQVEVANAQLKSAEVQVISAQANVAAAEGDAQKAAADTKRAEVNLSYCRIRATADGRITNKAVDPGEYVTSANPLFTIVPLNVWVTANFKETQLTHMAAGQPVTLKVDAYPDLALRGTINSIQSGTGSRFSIIPAENATGNFVKVVQRVPVKITLDRDALADPKRVLAPGMSVEPRVRVK